MQGLSTSLTRGLAVAAALAVSAGAARAASLPSTPAHYRARVNAICRGYTPKFKPFEADLQRAQAAGNAKAQSNALAAIIVMDLAQHRDVEAVSVPASMRAQVASIVLRYERIDAHFRLAFTHARNGDVAGWDSELLKGLKAVGPLDHLLDAAGLRDCGSNQK